MPNKLAIEPNFFGESNDFYFSDRKLNKLSRAMYQDTFGFYQRTFNLFQYMQMNRKNEFIVHYPKGQPLVWQPYQACSYENTNSLSLSKRTITPDPIYLREEFCHDSLMDSCFEHMLSYDPNGDISLDAEGVRLFNMLLEEFMANAALGFRISAVAGQLYDVDAISYSENNTADITSLFKRTHGTIRGFIKLAYDMARIDAPWMDLDIVADTDFDENGNYNGDVVDVMDAIIAQSRKPMRQLVNRGGIISNSRFTFLPVFVLSDGYYNAVIDYWNTESSKVATNRTRLTERTFGNETSPTPNRVYYLDGRIPIVPLSEITGFDDYLAGNTHFIGLVASGNMQLGASFTSMPNDIENNDIGIMVARNNDRTRTDYGTYVVLSHALAKTAIADKDFFTGCINYTTPV